MGIFSRTKTPTVSASTQPAAAGTHATDRDFSTVLKKPQLTEKAMAQSDRKIYTFVVAKNATKYAVASAIKEVYGVTPVKVNIVNKLPRKSLSGTRGRVVAVPGYKKAYVYLKEGDTINLV